MPYEQAARNLCLSNAILAAYLRILQKYKDTATYQEFLSSLQVDEGWLKDPSLWHDIAFHDRFIRAIKRFFPQEERISYRAAESVFKQKSVQIFSSIVGLLLDPKVFWSRLPTSVTRMNLYNSYEFHVLDEKLTYARGVLIQKYQDFSMVEANAALCEAAQGSGFGVLQATGYTLLEFKERKCIRRGDPHCEFEYTWRKRPLILTSLALTSIVLGVFALLFRLGLSAPLSLLNSALVAAATYGIFLRLTKERALRDAFGYQKKTLVRLGRVSAARELLNSRLLEYQKQLDECVSVASVGNLSFRFANALDDPLTLLTVHTDEISSAIKENFPNEERLLTYCRSIEEATQRMVKLQELFRMLVKNDSSERIAELDLVATTRNFLDLYGLYFQRNRITTEFHCTSSTLPVSAYEGSIETILLNLVQNASTALVRSKERRLSFRLSDLGDRVAFEIADTGPGISLERLQKLWQRFGPTQGGTGFGLYHVKQLVDRLHGEINVKSGASGTCFRLVFRKKLLDSPGAAG